MDRWLKCKSNLTSSEGEPASKNTPEERTSTSDGAGASDVGNPPDAQTHCYAAGTSDVSKQPKDKFQANWLRIYPWLERNNGEMSCSICKMYGALPFTSRCYKTSTLRSPLRWRFSYSSCEKKT